MEDNRDIVGRVLHDTYRITGKIAEGGMGAIYAAEHARLSNKRYAVKMLHASARSPETFGRFRREAEIASDLGHPNIVDVLDFYHTEDGQPYMVMEYLEGEDLRTRMRRLGRLPPAELLRVAEQAGGALQVAHDRGVVHRDLKPENIFLQTTGGGDPQVKVLDFGISKIRHSASLLTQDQAVFGTPAYMSPEQGKGLVRQIDHTTDVFAMAVICYEGLAGRLPFDGATPLAIIRAVCEEEPPPITDLLPGLPHAVHAVLARGMAKEKAARHPRILDLVGDLRRALTTGEGALVTMPLWWEAGDAPPVPAALADTERAELSPVGLLTTEPPPGMGTDDEEPTDQITIDVGTRTTERPPPEVRVRPPVHGQQTHILEHELGDTAVRTREVPRSPAPEPCGPSMDLQPPPEPTSAASPWRRLALVGGWLAGLALLAGIGYSLVREPGAAREQPREEAPVVREARKVSTPATTVPAGSPPSPAAPVPAGAGDTVEEAPQPLDDEAAKADVDPARRPATTAKADRSRAWRPPPPPTRAEVESRRRTDQPRAKKPIPARTQIDPFHGAPDSGVRHGRKKPPGGGTIVDDDKL